MITHPPFYNQRDAALALLHSDLRLTRKSGSFLGQCCVDETPLSDKQRVWLDGLLQKADLPPLYE
jgi:hypothetical protein